MLLDKTFIKKNKNIFLTNDVDKPKLLDFYPQIKGFIKIYV